jgi:hypothetical protein
MTKRKKPEELLKRGQPTKYDSKYCDELIKHMESGLSFESFAGVISVHRDTLYEWAKTHPQFSDAMQIGRSKSLLWWDKIGVAGTVGKIKNFNFNSYRFNMATKHNIREQFEESNAQKENQDIFAEAIAELERELRQ